MLLALFHKNQICPLYKLHKGRRAEKKQLHRCQNDGVVFYCKPNNIYRRFKVCLMERQFVFLVLADLEDVLDHKSDDLEFCRLILFFFHRNYLPFRSVIDVSGVVRVPDHCPVILPPCSSRSRISSWEATSAFGGYFYVILHEISKNHWFYKKSCHNKRKGIIANWNEGVIWQCWTMCLTSLKAP